MERTLGKRNLGELGEAQFQTWCASEGITSNPSYSDRHGWDFIVEVPKSPNANSFIDESPSIYECKVQVKASERKRGFWQVSLQNLKNLLMSPLAVFFVFIEYGVDDNPEQVYLLEFDEELASRVLKRLREAQIEGKRDRLNKLSLRIKYSEVNALQAPFSLALKNKIEAYFRSNGSSVSERKSKWLKTLGYEEGNFELNFGIEVQDDILELHRFFLGYEDQKPVIDLSGRKRRFGLSSPIPEFEANHGYVKVDTSIREVPATAIFRTHKYSSSLQVKGVLLSSELNKSIEEKDALFRFKSPTLDILTGPSFLEIGFQILKDFTHEYSFESLISALRIAQQMYRTDQDILLEINAGEYGSFDMGYRTEYSDNENLDWLYNLVSKVLILKAQFELEVQDLKLSIESLYLAKDHLLSISDQIEFTKVHIDESIEFMNFPTKIKSLGNTPSYQEKKIAILSQSKTFIGNLSIVAYFSIDCDLTKSEEGIFNINILDINIGPHASTLVEAGSSPDSSILREVGDQFHKSFESRSIEAFFFTSDQSGKRILSSNDQKFELIYEK